MALGARVALIISDPGSGNAAFMMAQSNRPNRDSLVGLLLVAMAAESDENYRVLEEPMRDDTCENENELESGRCNRLGNLGPEGIGEGPFRSLGLSQQNSSTHEKGATKAGNDTGDRGSDHSGHDHSGAGDGYGDGNSDDNNNESHLYSRPSI